jgi:hypothetical protein
MATIANIKTSVNTYEEYKNAYKIAASALQNVITTGPAFYSNATMPQLFPVNWAAYQAYLVNLKNAIDAFTASVPVEPPLVS